MDYKVSNLLEIFKANVAMNGVLQAAKLWVDHLVLFSFFLVTHVFDYVACIFAADWRVLHLYFVEVWRLHPLVCIVHPAIFIVILRAVRLSLAKCALSCHLSLVN